MYKKVYFRIHTPIYYKSSYGVGFNNDQDRSKFDTEAVNVFLNDGWEVKEPRTSGGCYTVSKDKQELYLHPQSFSGVILEKNIPYIEELLNNNNVFRFEKTDIYEDVFDITDEEYLSMLESKRSSIELDLLELFKTKRSNLYKTSTMSVIEKVLDQYRIKRLSHYIGVYSSDNIDWKFITDVFKELINTKRIVTATTKNGTGYRTDKKLLPKKSA